MDYETIALLDIRYEMGLRPRFDILLTQEQVQHICSPHVPAALQYLAGIANDNLFELYITPGSGLPREFREATKYLQEGLVWQANIGHFQRRSVDKEFSQGLERELITTFLQEPHRSVTTSNSLQKADVYLRTQRDLTTDTTHNVIL